MQHPFCDKKSCFACEDFSCRILTTNDFGKKECPFYKTNQQVEEEKEYCRKRMAELKKGMEE